MTTVVAVVPARDRCDTVADTVGALAGIEAVSRVLVVDDGSTDATATTARHAGADVLRLPRNRGKGGALAAAVAAAARDADVLLLVDADVGASAANAVDLLGPVIDGRADLTIGILPPAGRQGGFGLVRRVAAGGVRRACGFVPQAPLSGQRAVRAELLRRLPLAPRFGLETAMTIDAVRAGARVLEVPVAMGHRHTGRRLAGFRHRAGQGADIVHALWPRLTSVATRIVIVLLAFVLALGWMLWSGTRWSPSSVPAAAHPRKVVLIGLPGVSWRDVTASNGSSPTLRGLVATGAVAAATVRTLSHAPSPLEGYATLGAGTRVAAVPASADAVDATGGGVVVRGEAATLQRNRGHHLSTLPGALGDALHRAGRRSAVVGTPDAAVALADRRGVVDAGSVAPAVNVAAATRDALTHADVVLVGLAPHDDNRLSQLLHVLPADALALVVSVSPPPGPTWHLTPMVAVGDGVVPGYLHSPSTKRLGLVTLTDVAPTVLQSLGVPVPDGMIGHAFRYHPGARDVGRLARLDRDSTYRDRVYYPVTLTFIIFQSLVYIGTILAFARWGGVGRAAPTLRVVALAIAAFPLATFLWRGVPDVARLGWAGVTVLLLIDVLLVVAARRARRHALSPLAWVLGASAWLVILDVASGARLQTASIVGYSPNTAARFFGIGNPTFAVLAATALLGGALHLTHAPRPREALLAVAAFFVLVVVVDGDPSLGDDVGGILTLVPVFGLALFALSGRRLSWRRVLAIVGVTAAVVLLAAGVDLLRPPDARTHLGRFASDLLHHRSGQSSTTIARKLSTNLRLLGVTVWTWLVPVIAAFMLYLLLWRRRAADLLPPRSPLRVGVVAALAAGLLGFALNDSGVVVTALVFVYIGPLLTMLALREPDEPVWLSGTTPAGTSPVGVAG